MKLIGIESASVVASVAVLDEQTVIAESTINYKITHSQSLLPQLAEICRLTEQELSEVDAIAVASGPGSFTGLRIGAATAKGLGLALKKPLVAVPTLDAMAYSLYGCRLLICPMMDARRGQIYTGLYAFDENMNFTVRHPGCAADTREFLEIIRERGERTVFLGDGVPVFRDVITQVLGEQAVFAPPHVSRQRAAAVASLGLEKLRRGETVDAAAFAPLYFRISQAERERIARLGPEVRT
ncbi:MAG: tRNA (adenosine(37)-N6)-threonylcarbamoyltransferase complex dimerization subunit type 1 TsaB [Lachnospiraceae bacterium]|nr:tRNA (adenosine(37)-N6)-threonylcarbamoyltransferase complex dimerization subunit type 1 TsaB [Lachnospiraceae bacterium]